MEPNQEILNPDYAKDATHEGCGGQLIYFPAHGESGVCERCALCRRAGFVEFEWKVDRWEFVFTDDLEKQRDARRKKRFAGSYENITGRKD